MVPEACDPVLAVLLAMIVFRTLIVPPERLMPPPLFDVLPAIVELRIVAIFARYAPPPSPAAALLPLIVTLLRNKFEVPSFD